ncbi:MAG: FG-GAP repeat protein, partial [Anaerolineae bacterium]
NSGAAYVFVRTAGVWTEDLKITASDGDEEDQFGYSVSLSGGTALIGAARDDDNGDHSGSTYVFQGPTPPPTETPRPTATPTRTPTATPAMPTATATMPPRLNYLPLIARQSRTSAGLSRP